MSLQELFLRSRGASITVEGSDVIQMDRIPLHDGTIDIRFKCALPNHGVAIKATDGKIFLPNGKGFPLLHVWSELHLPLKVSYAVSCPTAELRVWNIYRINHLNGRVTEDAWTGNAGMIVEVVSSNIRRYRCSDGKGAFKPIFEFEISWNESARAITSHTKSKETGM